MNHHALSTRPPSYRETILFFPAQGPINAELADRPRPEAAANGIYIHTHILTHNNSFASEADVVIGDVHQCSPMFKLLLEVHQCSPVFFY